MIEVKNNLVRHSMFWALTLPFIAVLVLPFFVSADSFRVSRSEMDFFHNVLGINVNLVSARADAWFGSWFVETGVVSVIKSITAGSWIPKIGVNSYDASKTNYGSGMAYMLYLGLWRISAPKTLSAVLSYF